MKPVTRVVVATLTLLACSHTPTDSASETKTVDGLTGPADIVIDQYGWPHITATTLEDAAIAEGYAMARDRMLEMEFFRRASSGRLAEVFGAVSAKFIETDILLRTLGLHDTSQQMWDALPDGRSRTLFEGYAKGVNLYLAELRSGVSRAPRGSELLLTGGTQDWTPVDSLSVLRLLVYYLSFNADEEINRTVTRDRARTLFEQADASHPDLLARHGFFSDVVQFRPPSPTATVPDFYASAKSDKKPAPKSKAKSKAGRRELAKLLQPLGAAAAALGPLRDLFPFGSRIGMGTNAWAISGTHTASGHALLANDPHVGLTAPSFLWGVHVVVSEGPDAVDFTGTSFPGVPGVIFGYNSYVAWGIANGVFDQTDVYDETVTMGTNGAPDTVLFQGQQVPIQTRVENIPNGLQGTVPVTIETVPHHGPILPIFASEGVPLKRTASGHALSVRWVAMAPSHEVEGLVGLIFSHDARSAALAVKDIEVPSMAFVFADRDGEIGFRAVGKAPIRAPAALVFDPVTNPDGLLPACALPGTGEAEWTGYLDSDQLPSAVNPAWIAASNNDLAGLSRDGNPFDARVYLGYDYGLGFRAERIATRIPALNDHARREDIAAIQSDHVVLAGKRFNPFILQALANLELEWATPGSQPGLADVGTSTQPRAAVFRDLAKRLAAWSFDSPSGLEPGATDAMRADSVASSVFHAWMARVLDRALSDEFDALHDPADHAVSPTLDPERRMIALLFVLEHPDLSRTRDATTGQSTLWDDLTTANEKETRDEILLQALVLAIDDLTAANHSSDASQWLWGNVHTVRFSSVFPHISLSLGTDLSIPPPGEADFPNGFPRPGGIETIDQGWPVLEDSNNHPAPIFNYTLGPGRRLTVEMSPQNGPMAFDAIAGGESSDVSSSHFRDEAELWRLNRTHPIPHTEPEISAAAEHRILLRAP